MSTTKKKKFVRKITVKNLHTGNFATVEIYADSMSKEAAIKAAEKTYGNSFKLINIII